MLVLLGLLSVLASLGLARMLSRGGEIADQVGFNSRRNR